MLLSEISQRDEMLQYLYEAHRDAYNHRPLPSTIAAWKAMSDIELSRECDIMSNDVHNAIEDQRQQESNAAIIFESHITKMMNDHNIDRETAIRWDIDALGITEDVKHYGMDYYAHHHGLYYLYFFKAA